MSTTTLGVMLKLVLVRRLRSFYWLRGHNSSVAAFTFSPRSAPLKEHYMLLTTSGYQRRVTSCTEMHRSPYWAVQSFYVEINATLGANPISVLFGSCLRSLKVEVEVPKVSWRLKIFGWVSNLTFAASFVNTMVPDPHFDVLKCFAIMQFANPIKWGIRTTPPVPFLKIFKLIAVIAICLKIGSSVPACPWSRKNWV